MRKFFLLIFIYIIVVSYCFAQDIPGKWYGVLHVQGIELPLVFNIVKTASGYESTMDSPDQKVMGLPVSSTTYDGRELKLEAEKFGLTYTATLDKDSNFVGTFNQGGQKIPLTISRKKVEKIKPARPQEPQKPFPYKSEEVSFYNKKGKDTLAGTLTLPEGIGNFPAVILISGSGPQNRDEEILGHKSFLVLADFLTRNGIAVLRYDDRGIASSTGNFTIATTADFADDAEAAFDYLKTRKDINTNKIGLMGHSEGGVVAPMVAARRKDVGFIVMLAGTGLPGDQILLLQQQLIGKANGVSEELLIKTKEQNEKAFGLVKKSNSTEELKDELKKYIKEIAIAENDSTVSDKDVETQINQIANPWMIYFIKYDPAPALRKVQCPVLAIGGSNDLQVPAKEDLEAIKNALTKGGNKNVTVQEIPRLNHLFQTSKTGAPSEYASIEETFSPVAMQVVLDWIKKQTASKGNIFYKPVK